MMRRRCAGWDPDDNGFQVFTVTEPQTLVADVRDCELVGGRLVAAGTPIDLIYKRVLIHELIGREGMEHPIVRAVVAARSCMVNPFRCKMLHKKASLAVLSDERNAALFSAEGAGGDRRPRAVDPGRGGAHARLRGRPSICCPAWRDRGSSSVLKPNDDYGGAGIVLGWDVDGNDLGTGGGGRAREPLIVQERVGHSQPSPTPAWWTATLVFAERIVDTAPFVFHGDYADGCLTRLSTAALLNVTAGGGSTVPTFVVERR